MIGNYNEGIKSRIDHNSAKLDHNSAKLDHNSTKLDHNSAKLAQNLTKLEQNIFYLKHIWSKLEHKLGLPRNLPIIQKTPYSTLRIGCFHF